MSRTSIYPYASPVPLPIIQGQGADAFPAFEPSEWLDTEEAARVLRVSKASICIFVKSGELKASFLGRRYLISRAAISEFVAGRQRRKVK